LLDYIESFLTMSGTIQQPDYEYVAYIDEPGDQGLQKVKPLDLSGSSEWLVVSGVVIRKANEENATKWVSDIIAKMDSAQLKIFHFPKAHAAVAKRNYLQGSSGVAAQVLLRVLQQEKYERVCEPICGTSCFAELVLLLAYPCVVETCNSLCCGRFSREIR
jgi:hypothetical protein